MKIEAPPRGPASYAWGLLVAVMRPAEAVEHRAKCALLDVVAPSGDIPALWMRHWPIAKARLARQRIAYDIHAAEFGYRGEPRP